MIGGGEFIATHYAIGGSEALFWAVVVLVALAIVYLVRRV